MKKYFRIHADPACADRWYLKAPIASDGREIDARSFLKCLEFSGTGELSLPIRKRGREVDFNFADFDMPVIAKRLNQSIFYALDEIQHIPVSIIDAANEYEILNILASVSCIDRSNSEFDVWKEEDGRPDKTGGIRMITRLRIDASKATPHKIFRLTEWSMALIVADEVRQQLQETAVTGICFEALN